LIKVIQPILLIGKQKFNVLNITIFLSDSFNHQTLNIWGLQTKNLFPFIVVDLNARLESNKKVGEATSSLKLNRAHPGKLISRIKQKEEEYFTRNNFSINKTDTSDVHKLEPIKTEAVDTSISQISNNCNTFDQSLETSLTNTVSLNNGSIAEGSGTWVPMSEEGYSNFSKYQKEGLSSWINFAGIYNPTNQISIKQHFKIPKENVHIKKNIMNQLNGFCHLQLFSAFFENDSGAIILLSG
jgi:hypothetical protein